MLDRLEAAVRDYDRVRQAGCNDSLRGAEALSFWIQDKVCPVVDQLLARPDFRKLARWPLDQLDKLANSEARDLVENVENALVASAKRLADLSQAPVLQQFIGGLAAGEEHAPPVQAPANGRPVELPQGKSGFETPAHFIATKPWRDLVCVYDYFRPVADLHLVDREAWLGPNTNHVQIGNFSRFIHPHLQFPGDFVVRTLMIRIAYWRDVLLRVQQRFEGIQLWDLVTDCFWCACCNARFYQGGANGHGMKCKRADLCPCLTTVQRKDAVRAVCAKLSELLQQDAEVIEQVIGCAQQLDRAGDDAVREDLNGMDRKVTALSRKIDDLTELAGEGTDEDRAALKAKIRAAQVERASVQAERARLLHSLETNSVSITPARVRELLADLTTLLEDGAAGKLGSDVIHKAAEVFRKLVGGRVDVHVEPRPGRKRTNVYGTFGPRLLRTMQAELRDHRPVIADPEAVRVWLRKPPRLDALAERVHQLMDLEGQSYRDAAKVLQGEGQKVGSGNVWCIYRRWYAMQGLPAPKRPYNNGRPRKSA